MCSIESEKCEVSILGRPETLNCMPKRSTSSSKQGTRSHQWIFTINIKGPQDRPVWFPDQMRFLKYQEEIAPTTGQHHWQGVMKFKERVSLKQAKKLLGCSHAHLEVAMAWKDAVAYVSKEESSVPGTLCEFGADVTSGYRSDLHSVCQRIREGASVQQIAEESGPVLVRYSKGLQAFRTALQGVTMKLTRKCVLLLGDTGAGKTRYVYDRFPHSQVYSVLDISKGWFDGYEGHRVALFDECGEGMLDVNLLKKLCDIYPMQVQVKGGSVAWNPDFVFLTSNLPMANWWKQLTSVAHYEALQRRIKTFTLPRDRAELDAYIGEDDVAPPPVVAPSDDVVVVPADPPFHIPSESDQGSDEEWAADDGFTVPDWQGAIEELLSDDDC